MVWKRTSVALAIFSLFLMASSALAVTTVTVTSTTGTPVPGASFTLVPAGGGTPIQGRTGADGTGTVTVPAGSYRLRVNHPSHAPGDRNVSVGSGDSRVNVEVDPIFPWMVQNPPGRWGGLGVGFKGTMIDDLKLTRSRLMDRVNDQTFTIEQDADQIDQRNRDNDFKFDMYSGAVFIPIGLPSFHLGSWVFYPAFSIVAGAGSATFDIQNRQGLVSYQRFDGTGPLVGGEVELVGLPWAGSPWFFGLGGSGWTIPRINLDPDNANAGNSNDDIYLSYYKASVRARAGYSLLNNHLAPWAGVQGSWGWLNFTQESNFDLGGSQVHRELMEDFEDESVEGLVGLDAWFGGPFFARGEAGFNGEDINVLAKFVFAFRLGDLFDGDIPAF